jgi:cytochrome P450
VLRVEQQGGEPFWAITRYDDVMTVERAPTLFTNEEGSTLMLARPPKDEQQAVKTLINMDGEEHREHRVLINEWFKPKSIKRLNDAVEQRARESVDEMVALGGECDFARDIAMNYPLRVILTILGLPDSDFDRMLSLTQELFGSEDPEFARPAEEQQSARSPSSWTSSSTSRTWRPIVAPTRPTTSPALSRTAPYTASRCRT